MTEPALISEELLSWVWKVLLIMASAVPIVSTILVWFQNNFEMPMPKAVRDSILTSPLIFSVFIGLIAASFAVQYFFGSPTRRKNEIRRRAPVLVFIGPIVVLIVSMLAWWRSDTSLTAVLSEVAEKPFMLGSVAGLTVGSLILAFALSAREEQERCFKVLVTLASVFLMFGGPTYLIYGLQAVELPYLYATLIGLASFVTGIVIFLRFVIKETKI